MFNLKQIKVQIVHFQFDFPANPLVKGNLLGLPQKSSSPRFGLEWMQIRYKYVAKFYTEKSVLRTARNTTCLWHCK